MKKILLSVVVMGVMSVSAFADDGKIGKINFEEDGNVYVTLVKADSTTVSKKLGGTGDIFKTMIAAVLTAKSTNADVTMWLGTNGWKNIAIK